MSNRVLGLVIAVIVWGLSQASGQAGVFDTVHFLSPGEFSIGLEPEIQLSNGGGVGLDLKYSQGLNELTTVAGILGASGGTYKFRVGGQMTFDFFPDVEGQPGIGVTTKAMYYRLADTGSVEITAIPYIHKTFHVSGLNEVEPFLALPVGLGFSDGRYQAVSTLSLGSLFKSTDHLRYVFELGIGLNNTESYLSGGIVYYH